MKKILSVLLVAVMLLTCIPLGALNVSAATTKTKAQAMAWLDSLIGTKVGSGQCVALIKAYYEYLGVPSVYGDACTYATDPNKVPYGWQRLQGATPQTGDILIWTQGYNNVGHVAICGGNNKYFHQNWGGFYVQVLNNSYTSGFSVYSGAYYANYWGVIRPKFSDNYAALVTPTITFNKSSYTLEDTITVSWKASPSNSNLSHYWITVTDAAGKVCVDGRIDKSKTSYSFKTPGIGTYKVKVFATPIGSEAGEGSLTDTKSITINAKSITVSQTVNCNYTLTVKANSGKIPLYDNATTYVESDHWYNNKTSAFNIYCTKKVALSNGTVRYYFYVASESRGYYVAWNPNIMTVVQKHSYTNSCDTSCNSCGATRSISHTYSNSCDSSCNVCGATRNVTHTYTNSCDTSCNRCSATRTIVHTYGDVCGASCIICGAPPIVAAFHNYSAATCTKAKTCKICGKTSGSALGHTYTNSCDTTCNTCGATRNVTHNRKIYITPATTSKDGKAVKKCTVCGSISSQRSIKKIKSFALSTSTYLYNGNARKPGVTIKDSAGKVVPSKFYTVTYPTGRKNVGQYKITIKFKGDYSGSKNIYFTIVPPKSAVSKLTAGKKSITVNLTKKSTQVTGYQIQYSTNKSFTSPNRKTIGSYKTTKYTLKNLKAKKTYYVRVRTYKKVGSTIYYSPWSAYKSVKTK